MIALAPLMAIALAAQEVSPCPSAPEGWLTPAHAMPRNLIVNRLKVSGRDGLLWNGAPISRATLRAYLGIVRAMAPQPLTLIEPGPDADCRFLEALREEIARAIPCGGGLCGEGTGWELADDRPIYAPAEQPGRPASTAPARGSRETERLVRDAERQIRAAERAARNAAEAAESAAGPR